MVRVRVRARLGLGPWLGAVQWGQWLGAVVGWWGSGVLHISRPPHSACAARMQGPMALADGGMAWILTGMMGS